MPVDLAPDTMAPRPESLARALSPRSRALLVAHLFGGRLDLRPSAEFLGRLACRTRIGCCLFVLAARGV